MRFTPRTARSVLLVLAVGLLAGCGALPSSSAGASAVRTPSPSGSAPGPDPTAAPVAGHELYGFVPYWEMDASIAAHVAATPLTTVGLFSVTSTAAGALDTGQRGYQAITGEVGAALVAAARRRGTRVELVFTSFGAGRNTEFFGRAAVQEATIATLASLVGSLGLDGVCVDVEGLDIARAGEFGSFAGRLRDAILAGDPRRTVSVATGTGPTGAAMAAAAVAAGVDRVFLMGYDYRTAASPPGATAPIERADGGRSLTWTLDLYASAGVPPGRLLLGLPLYGVAWPVAGPVLGAPATGPGRPWVLRRNLGILASPRAVPATDPLEAVDVYFLGSDGSLAPPTSAPPGGTPGAATPRPGGTPGASPPHEVTWTAVFVDSPATLARKLGLGEGRGLAGAGFWAIGYERGLPAFTDLMARFVTGVVPAS